MRRRHEGEVPWGSFADALSGILFVFILTTFWFAWQLAVAKQQAEKEKEKAEKQTAAILDAGQRAFDLTRELGKLTACLESNNRLDARPSPDEPRLSLYVRSLHLPKVSVEWFERGAAALDTEERRRAADEIRECIGALVDDRELVGLYRIRVYLEGHTDSEPFKAGDDESNWELSGKRAAAVVRRVLDGSNTRITGALASGDLQVMAVGMADRQPAWGRVCEEPDLRPEDRAICDALLQDGDVDALLSDPALYAFDESCAPRTLDPAKLTRPELIRHWANRCPEPGVDLGKTRRGLLRRVDLRLELLPRVSSPPDPAP